MKTDSKKIFLDTAPIIYYLQNNEWNYEKMKAYLVKNVESDFVTSAITVTEYLTYPYRQNDLKLVNAFYSFIDGMEVQIYNIDRKIAEKAAQIRAENTFFKTMDALQLASAYVSGCDLFLTNDKQLRQFKEIKCITVDELE